MCRMASKGAILSICILLMSCSCFTPSQIEPARENNLTIAFPQSTTELVGGQSFRITIILNNNEGKPIESALVSTRLLKPDGEEFGVFSCLDKKDGRYISEAITLPLKDSQGVWKLYVSAIVDNEVIAQANGEFTSQDSYSEKLQQLFGFWIELTDLFPYNVSNAEDPLLKTYSYDDGGYVILANNLTTGSINNSFVILDVHWREAEFPVDEKSAANYVLNLAGPHRISLDISSKDLSVTKEIFQGWNSWHVTGTWDRNNAVGNPGADASLDWRIFTCPGSEWLWTILITTNEIKYMDDLVLIRETFECR